jgi:hypothetical protein
VRSDVLTATAHPVQTPPGEEYTDVMTDTSPTPAAPTSRIEVVLPSAPASHPDSFNELASHAAWPIAALLIALVLRNSISGLLHRATKFSIGMFALELVDTAAKALAIPAIDEIQETASAAVAADSSKQLVLTINEVTTADYATVNLGGGQAWLTSRLYLLAKLAPRMRGVRAVVFEATEATDSASSGSASAKYVGIADAQELADTLASRYPWLEIAFIHACNKSFEGLSPATVASGALPGQLQIGASGRLNASLATTVVTEFKKVLQDKKAPPDQTTWTFLYTGQYWERAKWVNEADLKSLLGDRLSGFAAVKELSMSDDDLARQVLRGTGRLMPVVNQQRELLSVKNRHSLLNRVARLIADQR